MAKRAASIKTRDLKVEKIKVSNLVPYAKNARTHSPEQVDVIAASITEFGWTNPVLHDGKGGLIAGHGRRLAAIKLGLAEVPAISLKGLTKTQIKALVIADNRIAEGSTWDKALLKVELDSILGEGFSLAPLGFTLDAFDSMFAKARTEGESDPDAIPAPAAEIVSKTGDVWTIGDHRLVCGDSTDPAVIERALGGQKPDAVMTDPPYGVDFGYDQFKDSKANVATLIDKIMPLLLAMKCPIALTPGVPMMWSYPRPTWVLVWIHPAGSGGSPWGFSCINPILVYGADPYLKKGLGRQMDHLVLAADREGVEGHPAPKPIKVWEWLLARVTTARRQVVFEPFCGAGTTIIAAQTLGRRCCAVELSPAYCDLSVRRWEAFTGQKAINEATGQPFGAKPAKRKALVDA